MTRKNMTHTGVSEPAMAYAASNPSNPLEDATAIAKAILKSEGITPVKELTEDMEDESSCWTSRAFFIALPSSQVIKLNVKLAEQLAKNPVLTQNVIVLYRTA